MRSLFPFFIALIPVGNPVFAQNIATPPPSFFDLVALSRLHGIAKGGPSIGFYIEYENRSSTPVSVLAYIPRDTGDFGEVLKEDAKDFLTGVRIIQPGKKFRVFVNRTLPEKYHIRATTPQGESRWAEGPVVALPVKDQTIEFTTAEAVAQCQEVDGVVICQHLLDEVVEVDHRDIKILQQPPNPPYPAVARLAKIQGTVSVDITVGRDGVPKSAKAISGPPQLMKASEAYALTWRFMPKTIGGIPRVCKVRQTVSYRLTN